MLTVRAMALLFDWVVENHENLNIAWFMRFYPANLPLIITEGADLRNHTMGWQILSTSRSLVLLII